MSAKEKFLKLLTAFFIGAAVAFGFLKPKKEESKERIISNEKK